MSHVYRDSLGLFLILKALIQFSDLVFACTLCIRKFSHYQQQPYIMNYITTRLEVSHFVLENMNPKGLGSRKQVISLRYNTTLFEDGIRDAETCFL